MKGLKLLQKARDLDIMLPKDGKGLLFWQLLSAAISIYISSSYLLVRDMERVNIQYNKLVMENKDIRAAYVEFNKGK